MEKANKIIGLLESEKVELSDIEKQAIIGAFCTKGPYKGYLSRNKPNGNKKPLSAAAWLAIQPNPFKTSIMAIMMLFDEEKALYDKLSKFKYPSWLDRDREALEKMRVW